MGVKQCASFSGAGESCAWHEWKSGGGAACADGQRPLSPRASASFRPLAPRIAEQVDARHVRATLAFSSYITPPLAEARKPARARQRRHAQSRAPALLAPPAPPVVPRPCAYSASTPAAVTAMAAREPSTSAPAPDSLFSLWLSPSPPDVCCGGWPPEQESCMDWALPAAVLPTVGWHCPFCKASMGDSVSNSVAGLRGTRGRAQLA